jgi:hypothetical protein
MMTLFESATRVAFVALAAVLLGWGCSSRSVVSDRERSCRAFDSLYATSGFDNVQHLVGSATVDADQHRLRGKVDLRVESNGDIYLDFTSTILFGARREDFFFSLVNDTLRVVDRERGAYFEEENAEAFLSESLGMAFGVREALGLAMGHPPACHALRELEMRGGESGEVRFDGRVVDADFRVIFGASGRRLQELNWPVQLDDGEDRLKVTYDWKMGEDGRFALRQVVMWLEYREWRCRLTSASL